MDYEEAKYQLRLHCGVIDEARKAMILDDGFLTSLRPYRGLQEKNLHLVMEALLTAGERIYRAAQVDRDLITTIWSMCWYARVWGLHPDGMLQGKNPLISAEDTTRLELWIDTIEQTALSLLYGSPPHKAVYHYAQYVIEVGSWDNIAFFITLMDRAVSDPHTRNEIEMILSALGKLGSLAKVVLPTLRDALQRTYSYNYPEFETPIGLEGTTESVRARIRKAIQAIEHDNGGVEKPSAQSAETVSPSDRPRD